MEMKMPKAEGKPNKGEEAAKEPRKMKKRSHMKMLLTVMRFKKIFDASSTQRKSLSLLAKSSTKTDVRTVRRMSVAAERTIREMDRARTRLKRAEVIKIRVQLLQMHLSR